MNGAICSDLVASPGCRRASIRSRRRRAADVEIEDGGSASDYWSSKIVRINRETEDIAAKLSKLYQPLKLPGLAAAR